MHFRYIISFIALYCLVFANVMTLAKDSVSACNNQVFLQAQQAFENSPYSSSNADVPVHVCGKVIAVSKARYTRSGEHGYFYLNIGSGVSIRIVSNLDEMHVPSWPWVQKGDYAEVVGRYYYDNP